MYFLKNFLNYFFGAVLKITKLRRVNHWAASVKKIITKQMLSFAFGQVILIYIAKEYTLY